ncbi:MAG: twin-arginine translocase TatA/TatE family subunit [Firmicutes bacterium]|nr:twin-arginine translocase TatA/TatE family subunit [Bacillota bacterium]
MGPVEWVIILIIVLLIFGPKRLPDLAKGLGKGLRGFKEEMKTDDGDKVSDKVAKKEE